MLNRRRRQQQTPTFLEGTPGLYVRRESPPRVPSTAPIPSRGDVTPHSGMQSNASRSLSGSHSSLVRSGSNMAVTRKTTAPLGASTPALVTPNLYASAASVGGGGAFSNAYDCPPNNFSSVQNFANIPSLQQFQNHYKLQTIAQSYKQFQKQQQQHNISNNGGGPKAVTTLSQHNDNGAQRRTVARHELSSHSFNNPPSTSWTATRGHYGTEGVAAGFGARPSNLSMMTLNESTRKNSSADASESGNTVKYQQNTKRHLATSLSFGNVMESLRDVEDTPRLPNRVLATVLSRVSTNATAHFDNIPRQKSITSDSSVMKLRTAHGSSSTSLQSLPGSSILREQSVVSAMPSPSMTSQHQVRIEGSTGGSSGDDPEAELELPPNWEVEVTPDGIRYYVDHNHQRTHWIHPLAPENLSPGWIKIFDPAHGVVYYNEVEKRSQFEHPGLATQGVHFHPYHHAGHLGVGYHHNTQLQQSKTMEEYQPGVSTGDISGPPKCIEDLNIIDDKDVPEWIRLYSEAPFESDHLLDWKMFDVPQLEEFDQMLMKLFKQDAINTVIKYERPRREINDALMTRNVIIS